jgi:hypothetical protein
VQEGNDLRKQWFGFFLISTTLDVHSLAVLTTQNSQAADKPLSYESFSSGLVKHLNTYLSQISVVIGKSELIGCDQTAISIKAWAALVELMHSIYDSKLHASCLQAHKQIMMTVFKKLEKTVKNLEGTKKQGVIQIGNEERV